MPEELLLSSASGCGSGACETVAGFAQTSAPALASPFSLGVDGGSARISGDPEGVPRRDSEGCAPFLGRPACSWVEEEMVAEPDISRFADDVADVGTDARSGLSSGTTSGSL